MHTQFSQIITLSLLLCATLTLHGHAKEPANPFVSVYVETEDPMRDVQVALDRAKSTGKLLLVVMGAQWCHDSRGLAEKFDDPAVAKVLAARYETVFVDVGYLGDLRAISQRFGQAHYFATPTVMIINADTERLMNAQDMHIWGSADRLPASRYLQYFTAYADNPPAYFAPLPEHHAASIAAFEQQNAERLTKAYRILAPGLEAEDRTGKASDEFIQQWREVRRYRVSLQKDIQTIRQQAIDAPATPLVLPAYDNFSWE